MKHHAQPGRIMTRQPFVQQLRFVAAMVVFMVHFAPYYKTFGGNETAHNLMQSGWVGVSIFFVISGYVIVLSTSDGMAAGTFMRRRMIRIFPLLWLAVLVQLAVHKTAEIWPFSTVQIFNSLTLLDPSPSWKSHALTVAWSLVYEMAFYTVFAIYLLLGRRLAVVYLLVAVIVCEFSRYAVTNWGWALPGILWERWTHLLALGAVAGWVSQRFSAWQTPALVTGLLLYGAGIAVILLDKSVFPSLIFGAGTALLIYGAHRTTITMAPRTYGISDLAGNVSYAFYLLHVPFMGLLGIAGATPWLFRHTGPEFTLVVIALIITVLSALVHLLVEKPVTNGLRRRLILVRPCSNRKQETPESPVP